MFREKVFGVLAKIEVTSGTDSLPVAGTDAVRQIGIPTLEYAYLETGERQDAESGVLGAVERAVPAGTFGRIDITLEIRGAGAAYSATVKPEADVFWRMAGFGVTTSFTAGAESYRYQSIDSGMQTGTLYLHAANKLFKMVGCVAAPKLTGEALKRGFVTFSVTGKIILAVTEIAVPALTINVTLPPLFHSGATSIGAWTQASAAPLVLRRVDLDFGTVINDRPSAGATDGLIGYVITDRRIRQTMLVEVVPLATFDPYVMSKAVGATLPTTAYQWGVTGAPGQYNRLKVVTGRWALLAPGHGSDRGLNTWNLVGDLVQGTEPVTSREAHFLYD